ncbi:MAG TPA: hydrogenase maturation protease [Bryobacteraceae bacterium]|nr:hydrogenase maturation protease [Bryobacteraceae bacterium]
MKILVACIGNIFLGDDGFGCEVARLLRSRPLPEGVVLKDFGIRGLDLAYSLMEPYDLAILVDACPRGAEPGTIHVIEPDEQAGVAALDPHSMDPASVLRATKSMGAACPVLIVGCEPADLGPEEGKIGLSKPVAAAVEEAANVVERLIHDGAGLTVTSRL